MLSSDTSLLASLVSNVESWSSKHYVEVHTVDTNARVILDTKINVFLDAKTKVASTGEIALPQLVLTHLM